MKPTHLPNFQIQSTFVSLFSKFHEKQASKYSHFTKKSFKVTLSIVFQD